ncbi:aminopeptidase NAALADL1-like isoform X2 [Babylonia areolata]|uniref:aminopeptidase NAALADL1-like isoform X2 n=1 Tax=Babylonia areolata TaxID=304850 RepID=UPI003FD10FAA
MIVLLLIGLCVIFLLGFCLGFYVRESQTEDTVSDILANCGGRQNERNAVKLTEIHDDIMYRIRGEYIRQFMQNFSGGQQDPVTGSVEERRLAQSVRQLLQDFTLDDLHVEEYDVAVTFCDPSHPNLLQIIQKDTNDVVNVTLRNDVQPASDTSHFVTKDFKFPYVVHSPAGVVEGSLVYGHYGSETDLLVLQAKRVSLKNRIVLMRLGTVSLAEKVQNVALKGALGVLVYWDLGDAEDNPSFPSNTSHIPYASAAVFSSESFHPLVPTIPVQTISTDTASLLLQRLHREQGAVSASPMWSGGLRVEYTIGRRNNNGGNLTVRLSVFNKKQRHIVKNIISDIHGTEEKDRYVVIGAPRASLPGMSQDAVTSSALLIQVARALNSAHQLNKWKPVRGIKIVSWGGADLGNLGMLQYLKTHHHLLSQRAVGYFDVSQLVLGTDVVTARVSPGLYQVINEVTSAVPDPKRPEQSIQSSWQERYKAGEVLDPVTVPLSSYHSDHSATPFLHALGVTSVSLQYHSSDSVVNDLTVSSVNSYENGHHYKYHTAVLRVMMQVVLSMVDDDIIPYSLTMATTELTNLLWETSDTLQTCSKSMQDLDSVLTLSRGLQHTAEVFEELIEMYRQKRYTQGYRMINDVKLLFERIFITHSKGQLCRVGDLAQVWDATDRLTERLHLVLTEAVSALRTTN